VDQVRPSVAVGPSQGEQRVTLSVDTSGGRLADDVGEAFRRCNELEAALRFYADHRNHRGVGVSPVYNDGGRRARQVLATCETCEGRSWVKTGRRLQDQDGLYDEIKPCSACWGSGLEGVR